LQFKVVLLNNIEKGLEFIGGNGKSKNPEALALQRRNYLLLTENFMRKTTLITYLSIFICLASFFVACKKDKDPTPPDDETPEVSEVAKAKTGVILTPKEDYEKITLYVPKTFAGGRTMQTTAADLTSLMPPIGDQGQQGSCSAFATVYAIKSYLDHVEKNNSYTNSDGTINYSSLASPAYVYNRLNGGYDHGLRADRGFDFLQREGVCSWKEMPYIWSDFLSQPSAQQTASAASNKLFGWGRTVISSENFKLCIQEGLPIYISSNMTALQTNGSLSPMIWNGFDPAKIESYQYHAMVIVGFDDNIKAFKLMNSWGTSWGNKGYSWLSYDIVKIAVSQALIGFTKSMEPKITEYVERQTNTGEGTWTRMQDHSGHAVLPNSAFTIKDTIYFVGRAVDVSTGVNVYGNYELLAFQPKINAWKVRGTAPEGIESGGFVINDRAYLMLNGSGGSAMKKVMEYDPASNRWTAKKEFAGDNVNGKEYKRSRAAMFSYNNKGYYGLNASSFAYSTTADAKSGELWEYNPANDSWQIKTHLPIDWCNGVAEGYGMMGSKLNVVHGEAVNPRYSADKSPFFEFDFNTGQWQEKGTISPRMTDCVSGILNGDLYVGLGGFAILGKGRNDIIYGYDPQRQKWDGRKPIPVGTDFSSVTGAVWNNRLYTVLKKSSSLIAPYQLWEFKP
jgi:hypothetical protein